METIDRVIASIAVDDEAIDGDRYELLRLSDQGRAPDMQGRQSNGFDFR